MRTHKTAAGALIALSLTLAACGGSSKSSDTTAAPDTTVVAELSDTTVAEGSDTTVADAPSETTIAAVADALSTTLITQILQGVNGGTPPTEEQVACVSGKVKPEELAGLISAASGGTEPDATSLKPILKAVFQCKPDGLVDQIAASFDTLPAGVTEEEKKCLAGGVIDILADDDELFDAALSGGGALDELSEAQRKQVVKKLTPAVDKCISDEANRDAVIKELGK